MKSLLEAKREVLEAAQEMYRRGWVAGTSGNCSVIAEGGEKIVITPTSLEYDLMSFEDMVVLDRKGTRLEGKHAPSIEFNMHTAIYDTREDVGGIVHTHQIMASALGVVGMGIPPIIEETVFKLGGEIRVADYALPGTPDLAQNVVEALGRRNACILAHHGALGVGKNARDAILACEVLERTSSITIFASLLGEPRKLPEDIVKMGEMLHGGKSEDEG